MARSRDSRELDALRQLLAERDSRDVRAHLQLAADALRGITHADSCVVFREVPGGGFRSDVIAGGTNTSARFIASRRSKVSWVARHRQIVRVRDFADAAERINVFGSVDHDEKLSSQVERHLLKGLRIRSLMMAPVEFEQHSIAVILLLNKQPAAHLAATFSATDQTILATVCKYLAGVLPSVEMFSALSRMSNSVSPLALEKPEERRKMHELLVEMLPGITSAALIRPRRGEVLPHIDVLGGELWTDEPAELLRSVGSISPVHGSECWFYTTTVDSHLPDTWLTLQLTRDYLSGYEKEVIAFFKKELSHFLIAELGQETIVDQFVELRHAIRSGLTGVVGYVHEALSCYELFRSRNFEPWVLKQARFRKALERADFSAAKTQQLLEDSRYLLGMISTDSLRLASHSVPEAVLSVLDTLRPFATERGVRLQFNNQLRPETERAEFDKTLIDMLIFNIVDNAIKYSNDARDVHITLAAPRRTWQLEVTDFGDFIAETDHEAIFLPFTRRPQSVQGTFKPGTGLGLAVAKQIVEAHGGDIGCRSAWVDKTAAETTFWVRLPRAIKRG